jgi:hypothetical protein
MVMPLLANSRLRVVTAGLASLAMIVLSACANDTETPASQTSYTPWSAAPSNPSDAPESSAPIRNDFAKLPLKRALDAGPLTVNVEYKTTLAVKDWRSGVSKPIRVTLTSINRRKEGQKIYLSKATATVTAYDEEGPVDGPKTITDGANITPGYIVTFPSTYNQTFSLPALDESAVKVTVDFTYELAQQVDKDKAGVRDFAKQVATDSITVPLAK